MGSGWVNASTIWFAYIYFKKELKNFLFCLSTIDIPIKRGIKLFFFQIKFTYINTWSIIKLHSLILQVTQNLRGVWVGSGAGQGTSQDWRNGLRG